MVMDLDHLYAEPEKTECKEKSADNLNFPPSINTHRGLYLIHPHLPMPKQTRLSKQVKDIPGNAQKPALISALRKSVKIISTLQLRIFSPRLSTA
jgi:hypothetical protein